MITVCMATYNGEKFIREQLQTILEQSKRADEVIICDDASKDNTVAIVEQFISQNRLNDTWKLYRNTENKGYPGNFYYAMEKCRGDIVFLADQDDIWHINKIEKMCDLLEREPDIKVLSCKFGLIDVSGKNIQTVMKPAFTGETGNMQRISIKRFFYKYEWPGMILAYRNSWYKQWHAEVPQNCNVPHDFLICARAAEENGLWQMDAELAYHRRHDNNVGGEEHRIKKLLNKQRKLKEIDVYLKNLDNLATAKILQTAEGKEIQKHKMESMRGRLLALESGKIKNVLRNAWKNRGEVRVSTVVCDLLIVKQS